MEDKIIVEVDGYDKYIIESGKTINDLVKENNLPNVIAALVDNEATELSHVLKEDCKIKLISTHDRYGANVYLNGLKFLYIVAIKELFGRETNVELKHSIDKGIYTTVDVALDDKLVKSIKDKMMEIVFEDVKIDKISCARKEAIEYYEKMNEIEKVETYKQMVAEVITLYSLLDYYDYFYSIMPVSTGVLKDFDLTLLEDGAVVLRYPGLQTQEISPYTHLSEVLDVFKNYSKWADKMHVTYVSDVNKIIIDGRIKEFIELNEIMQNEELNNLANRIKDNIDTIKLVCIAGPSSSGKTTTSKKLSLYLKSKGINPFIISVDNYFKNRVDTPKDEKGRYLYDTLGAIDVDLFNNDLLKLLNNEEVSLPEYNFITGEKEYKRKPVSLKERDVLIIEGIHVLNEELTKRVDRKNKYKIYVSPFTPLALDRHNHVSTVDLRFIRLLVRDYRTRGRDALDMLRGWGQVRDSEEKYIFPYQKEADAVFNTALIYEIGMLKTYAEPILKSVKSDSEYYAESLRIINFLNNFLSIPEDFLPAASILREFVGSGYFE